MAYKFQFGEARLSGSIVQTDGTTTLLGLDNSDANATSFGDIELDSLTADGSLITINNNTRMSGSSAVQFGNADTKIGGDGSGAMQIEVSGAANSLVLVHGSTSNFAVKDALNESEVNLRMSGSSAVQFGNADTKIGGDGSGAMQIEVSGAANSLVLVHGATSNFTVKDSENESQVNLLMSGSNKVQFNSSTDHIGVNSGTGNLEISSSANVEIPVSLIVGGDLTVQGTTTTVDSTTIAITGSLQFEGSTADGFETTFGVVDPTADATINLPAMSTGTYYLPVLAAASTTAVSATPAELNLLDGGTSVGGSITISDSDGFIVNDGGTMKSIPASDLKSYAATSLSVASKEDGDTLATGMNYFAALSADATVTLPASPSVGDLIYVKANSFSNGAGIIVNKAGSQTIDGQNSILLESDYAAVTLVYVASNDWRIV